MLVGAIRWWPAPISLDGLYLKRNIYYMVYQISTKKWLQKRIKPFLRVSSIARFETHLKSTPIKV